MTLPGAPHDAAARAAHLRAASHTLLQDAATLLADLRSHAGPRSGELAERLSLVRRQLRALAAEAARLAQEGRLARSDLLDCPDPPAAADAEIREDYAVLCAEVEGWFDDALGAT